MKKKTRQLLILNGLLILIVAAAILSVNSGYARIPFSTAVHSIFQPHMEGTSVVVAQFRVPRIVLAVLCGMGLALAGCVMQTVTGNPLADPGLIGVSSGAALAMPIVEAACAMYNNMGQLAASNIVLPDGKEA